MIYSFIDASGRKLLILERERGSLHVDASALDVDQLMIDVDWTLPLGEVAVVPGGTGGFFVRMVFSGQGDEVIKGASVRIAKRHCEWTFSDSFGGLWRALECTEPEDVSILYGTVSITNNRMVVLHTETGHFALGQRERLVQKCLMRD